MTKIVCDTCPHVNVLAARLFLATGRSQDASGSIDTDGEYRDVCLACLVKAVVELAAKNYDLGIELAARLKKGSV